MTGKWGKGEHYTIKSPDTNLQEIDIKTKNNNYKSSVCQS